jgi:hypothetical protein
LVIKTIFCQKNVTSSLEEFNYQANDISNSTCNYCDFVEEDGISKRELVLAILMPICALLLIIGLVAIFMSKGRKRKTKRIQSQLSIASKKQSIVSLSSDTSFNDSSNNFKNSSFGNFDTIFEETVENSPKIEIINEENDETKGKDSQDSKSINSNDSTNSSYLEMTMRI